MKLEGVESILNLFMKSKKIFELHILKMLIMALGIRNFRENLYPIFQI